MKKNFFLTLIISLILVSCNTHEKEIANMKASKDSLQKIVSDRDQTVNGYISNLTEIEQNLITIKEKEHIISVNTSNKKGELKEDIKALINDDIKDIYNLLIKNKLLVQSLNKKLKESNIKSVEIQKMVDVLSKEVSDKDIEINSLKDRLTKFSIEVANLNSNIENLTKQTQEKQNEIAKQTEELNTAYYIIGTKQELKEKKIITKEGGFIGLGKVEGLKNTADWSKFIKIDITKISSIPVNKKKASLITTHPEGSYKLEEGNDVVKEILITNQKVFWSISKYLVIVVK